MSRSRRGANGKKGGIRVERVEKIEKIVERLLYFLVCATFAVLIFACVLQVFTRFVLNNSLSWTEELARYAFIWSNFLGAAICTQKESHAAVTAVTDLLPAKAQTALKIAVSLIIILVAGVLIWHGFQVAYAVRLQLSPALRVSMALIYGAAPVCGVFVLFYSVLNLLRQIQSFRGKETGKW